MHTTDSDNDDDDEGVAALEQAIYGIDIDIDELEHRIRQDLESNIRHAAIEPARATCPFDDDDLQLFADDMDRFEAADYVPAHVQQLFAVLPNSTYPLYEEIIVGRRRQGLRIELPYGCWLQRAIVWERGLELMTAMRADRPM